MHDNSCPHKEMQMPHQRQVATEWQMANVAHTPRVASDLLPLFPPTHTHTHLACANGCVCASRPKAVPLLPRSHSMYLCRSPCPTSSTLLLSTSCGVTMTLVCHAPAHGKERAGNSGRGGGVFEKGRQLPQTTLVCQQQEQTTTSATYSQ